MLKNLILSVGEDNKIQRSATNRSSADTGGWVDLHRTELCVGDFYKPISLYILVTGVASGTATYVTSIVSNLTFTPLVLQLFGTKAAVVFGQLAYCIYICSNFYPSK